MGDIADELMCRLECRWIHINDHGFGVMLGGYLIICVRTKNQSSYLKINKLKNNSFQVFEVKKPRVSQILKTSFGLVCEGKPLEIWYPVIIYTCDYFDTRWGRHAKSNTCPTLVITQVCDWLALRQGQEGHPKVGRGAFH